MAKKQDIKCGDVLVTTCANIPIPCWHRAIVVFENGQFWAYQNTPTLQNEHGGNVCSQPLDDFFKGRKLLAVIPANLDRECVKRCSWESRFKKWDVLTYNCEDYVNEIAEGQRKSSLRNCYIVGILAFILLK